MSRLTEILEATAASREGGFGAFARKNPRQKDPREKGKQEWVNPNRTKIDDIKAGAGRMKKKAADYFAGGYTSKESREQRRQAKIQRASDSASQSIAADTPTATAFKQKREKDNAETGARIADRTLKKGDYEAERRKFRDKRNQQRQPIQLVPLKGPDEAKVRQLAQRLTAAQAEQLGQMIGNIISPPESEGTAEQVAKRQVAR